MNKTYEPVIGLEVHVELKTNSKMFCGCSADHFGKAPNTQTCPVCLGLPGALPVPNKKAIDWCIKLGLALNCTIPKESKFDRKNYFYPDLPKGYQISQYDKPLCENGWIEVSGRKIRIRRVHQEEDTGKLQHTTIDSKPLSLVDFNRSGVPLVEIVSEPDFHTIEEVDCYVKKIQRIIRYLDISNADMEKGSMRLEPSISLRPVGSTTVPNYRVELKNINSFRFVRMAIEYEIARQSKLLDKGKVIVQQTRGWSESKNVTLPQREKEQAHDYRYFPEPDIPPMRFDREYVENIKKQIPELPEEKKSRLIKTYNLSETNAEILTQTPQLADYFGGTISLTTTIPRFSNITPTTIANAIVNQSVDIKNLQPKELLEAIGQKQKEKVIDIGIMSEAVNTVLTTNSKAVEDYKKGKTTALMFLVGMVKRELKGKGDAGFIGKELKKRLI